MGRNTARGNSKRRAPRDQRSADYEQREHDLAATKAKAAERIDLASELQTEMIAFARKEFEKAKKAGDFDAMPRIHDFLVRCQRQDLQILGKKLPGGQVKQKGRIGAGAPAEEQGERSLDAFSA